MRAFILGNSGEILDHDLSLLKGETVFGSNAMPLRCPDVLTHYVCSDILMAFVPEIRRKVLPGTKKYYSRILWNTILHEDDVNVFDGVDNRLGFSMSDTHIYAGQGVGYMSIQIACALGFNPIYTLGIDMGLPPNGIDYIPEYEVFHKMLKKLNLRSPSRDKRTNQGLKPPNSSVYDDQIKKHLSFFHLAKKETEEAGIEIINLSRGGRLNMFKRQCYEDVVGQRKLVKEMKQ